MSIISRPIGIFDSGIGGLTVLKEIRKVLPYEDIIYFGDTARVPYGGKSPQTVVRFSTENILFLLEKKAKLVVVACNTSSSLALEYLKSIFTVPILGVIDSAVRKAIKVSREKKIGVIGTKSTIRSKAYQKKIYAIDKEAKVYAKPCPLFVPLVEEGLLEGPIVDKIVQMYLKDLKNKIDTLILGCTHYPLLKKAISRYLKRVYLVNSAYEVAREAKNILTENDLLTRKKASCSVKFYVSDEPLEFMKIAKIFLKKDIRKPEVVYV